ncbi:MAG: hypothetical protein H7A53_10385 [Akkermansiaceae bacterium]|nr:hypothetical protein [Akkermansiaceae bacterium]
MFFNERIPDLRRDPVSFLGVPVISAGRAGPRHLVEPTDRRRHRRPQLACHRRALRLKIDPTGDTYWRFTGQIEDGSTLDDPPASN